MRPRLIAMLLLTAVLAGCADDTTTTDDTDDGNGGDGGDGGNDGGDGGAANNTAPVANLTADVLNGTAPLRVNFTLDGSDADGDNLTWVIAINGNQTANGTTLPAAFNFTFEAGDHTVLLTVSDGNATAQANVTITVTAPGEAEEEEPGLEDRGWYEYDPATGLCHVKDYDEVVPGLYRSPLSGGDWFIAENNDIDGLQIENNHPEQTSGNFSLDIPDCVDGDQVVA